MEDLQLLIDLHKRAKRQGPGGDEETRKAVDLARLDSSTLLKVADIGCGTGASTNNPDLVIFTEAFIPGYPTWVSFNLSG